MEILDCFVGHTHKYIHTRFINISIYKTVHLVFGFVIESQIQFSSVSFHASHRITSYHDFKFIPSFYS